MLQNGPLNVDIARAKSITYANCTCSDADRVVLTNKIAKALADQREEDIRSICTYPWSACNSLWTHDKDCPSYFMVTKLKSKIGGDNGLME